MSHFQKIAASGKPTTEQAEVHIAAIDQRTGLMWAANDAGSAAFADAPALVAALNREALGGFTDWRLPTVEELFGLADRTRYSPAIDTDAFPTCAADWYWSSTVDAESPSDYAWVVYFYGGYCLLYLQNLQARVRAVRSVSPSASSQ